MSIQNAVQQPQLIKVQTGIAKEKTKFKKLVMCALLACMKESTICLKINFIVGCKPSWRSQKLSTQ